MPQAPVQQPGYPQEQYPQQAYQQQPYQQAPIQQQPMQPGQHPVNQFPAQAPPDPFGIGGDAGGVARLKEIRRKNAKRRNLTIIVGGAMACIIGMGAFFLWPDIKNSQAENKKPPPKKDPIVEAEKEEAAAETTVAESKDPTTGAPIALQCVPSGASIVISVRPADFWVDNRNPNAQEFLYGLSQEFNDWASAKLKELCKREPAQIEHALICVLLGPRGSEPEYAAVVKLVEEEKRSELINEFKGQPNEEWGYPIRIDVPNNKAYLLLDNKTIAICPATKAQEMAESVALPAVTANGIEALLNNSDVDRHFTVIFQPLDIRNHQEVLFESNLHTPLNLFLDWVNEEEVEAMSWSVHLGKEFYSEMQFRNHPIIRESKLRKELKTKMEKLPHDLLAAVEKMNPKVLGFRKLIGRFPAMMKVYSMATTAGVGPRYASMVTNLKSDLAGPNLALASVLTLREAEVTDFSKEVKQKAPTTKLPDLIADRLKMKIDLEFERVPLQEAIDYICFELKIKYVIDGDALKDSGFTKNMAQNHDLGVAPAMDGLQAIVKQYVTEGKNTSMCFVIDEQKKLLTLTTIKFAENQGLKPYPLK